VKVHGSTSRSAASDLDHASAALGSGLHVSGRLSGCPWDGGEPLPKRVYNHGEKVAWRRNGERTSSGSLRLPSAKIRKARSGLARGHEGISACPNDSCLS